MTPQEALTRIAALEVHDPDDRGGDTYDADEVRAVLAAVTPEPGGTLDRDQARAVLLGVGMPAVGSAGAPVVDDALLDRLAGCVRPVAGVTLTPEEAEWAAFALRKVAPDFGAPFQRDVAEKLAARLEATR